MAASTFWIAASLLVYAYIAYPAMLLAVSRFVSMRLQSPSLTSWPDVAVVIAACDEEKHIAARIRNLLEQDYPPEKLTVFIGSDGSRDSTVEFARKAGNERILVREFPMRRGKASVLNDLVAEARQPLIVFSDANTYFERSAIRNLVARLVEPGIGAVCGRLVLARPREGDNEDHQYWEVESRLKLSESEIDGLLGANGGIYAVRKSHVTPLRPDTICDDFVIVMNVALKGFRVVYEPRALAHEESAEDMSTEFGRRVRIGMGNYQVLARHPAYLTAMNWSRRWTYLSHKVLRWMTPHLLVLLLAASVLGLPRPFFVWLLALQAAAYAGAAVVYTTRRAVTWPVVFRMLSLFCVVNFAFAVAFVRFLGGAASGGWQRTGR